MRQYLKNSSQPLLVEYVRVCLYIIVLAVGILSYLLQPGFINWAFLGPFYALLSLGFSLHFFLVLHLDKLHKNPKWHLLSFVLDAAIFSFLIHFSGANQSLFLFLNLVNILLVGLSFQTSGALIVALLTSIFFTSASIFSPEIKALNFLFLLAINNIAFFTVAGLSGYLSEQLLSVGKELKKTGLDLQASLEFNQVLLENMPLGMVSFDGQGKILQNNPYAVQIFGAVLPQKNWFDLFPGFSLTNNAKKTDVRFPTQSEGEHKILGITVTDLVSPQFSEKIYLALIEDLTQIRQFEFSMRQNEKMAAVGGLAAGIAHEIRNPLAGISGSIELLSQTVSSDDDRKLMKIILKEIDRLNNLITEFLEYSRPEKPPTDPVNLNHLLREVLDSLKLNSNLRQDVKVTEELDENVLILGSRDKLKQAFLNIILNSYQAMQTSAQAQLQVVLKIESGSAAVKIKDTGCGMKEATLKRMFEPFHTTKPKGTGLGLAVTHKILEGHRAQIFVESEEGKGTEFILHFPLVQSEIK